MIWLWLLWPGSVPTSSASVCPSCAVRTTGRLAHRKIKEASGIAASAIHPGVFYVHNDSGDRARFFAIDEAGRDLGDFEVRGARNVDWEDVAVGACAPGGKSCLYFGDIGDAHSAREEFAIIRVEEPAQLGPGQHAVDGQSFAFRYPDRPHNAETLLLHPKTGVLTVVTKEKRGRASVYQLPQLVEGAKLVASLVGTLQPPGASNKLTGGSVDPSARWVAIRSYSNVLLFPLGKEQSVAQALAGRACVLPGPAEAQGEAVGWERSGVLLTVGEGRHAELHRIDCSER